MFVTMINTAKITYALCLLGEVDKRLLIVKSIKELN